MKDLEGKTALITGAARGQGRAHAVALAKEGVNIVCADLHEEISPVPYKLAVESDLAETVRLVEAEDVRAIPVKLDVSDRAAVDAAADLAVAEFGSLDIAVPSAGIWAAAELSEMTDEQWHTVMDINITAVFYTLRAAARKMIPQDSGRIICTSSTAGRSGMMNFGNYVAAKWGVLGLVKTAALELAPHHITVNAICPAAVKTHDDVRERGALPRLPPRPREPDHRGRRGDDHGSDPQTSRTVDRARGDRRPRRLPRLREGEAHHRHRDRHHEWPERHLGGLMAAEDGAAPAVLTEVRDGVLLVTLNRPEARNAVNGALAEGVAAAIERLEADADLRVRRHHRRRQGLLLGDGPEGVPPRRERARRRPWFRGHLRTAAGKPMIAAVEGFAVAGGLEVALSCDLIVAGRGARLGIPETKRGLIAGAGALIRLPQRIPRNVAMEMALTGELVSAARAYGLGLVNTVCEDGGAVEEALRLAAAIAANGPLAVRLSKQIVDQLVELPELEAWQRQQEFIDRIMSSEDAREGAAAFAEKRDPAWSGR